MTNTVTNQKSQTSYKAQKIISNVIIYAFLIFLLLLSIVPFYLVVVNATHSSFDIVTKLNLLPGKNTLENYTTMQSHVNIWRGFLNSLCVAVPFTFFTGYFGALISIDCTAVENEVADNMYQRSELDWLIYNDPAAYADLILNGDPETYLKSVTENKPLD